MMRAPSLVLSTSLLCGILAAGSVMATEGSLKGYVFGDYFFNASGPREDRNAFQIRRIYFTYDTRWDQHFSGRFRLEAKDAGFGRNEPLNPFAKDMYLRYQRGGRSIYAGLLPTPTWEVSEGRIWKYRAIEKTIMDLNKIGHSRDTGLAYKGRLDGEGKLNLQFMLGNGTGTKSESDNDKKIYVLLHLKPAGALEATGYFDWQDQSGGRDQFTFAAMVGSSGQKLHGGLEGFVQLNQNQAERGDLTSLGLSLYGGGRLNGKSKLFGRFDFFDPDDDASDDRRFLLIGGVDLMPRADIHIMPNVRVLFDEAPGVETEFTPRLTGFFKW